MLRRALLVVVLLLVQGPIAEATWSIVVVNRRTGEVAIGAATCLSRLDLTVGLPSVIPGIGGGVVQAAGSGTDLVPMTEGLRAGLTPAQILPLVLAAEPSPQITQTAIVSLYPGAPVTFTGSVVGRARTGVSGEVGALAYAIQGNVLANNFVVFNAETALLGTPGDLSQKLMAAMEAARKIGGDGRCSCPGMSANCGIPVGFRKSAHCGFMIVSRVGDEPPPCIQGADCATGEYFMELNVALRNAEPADPDPVEQLSARYAAWRASRIGRPDGVLSKVEAVAALPADGRTRRDVTVLLVDIDGTPLAHGGARVAVASTSPARPRVLPSPVADLGDGRYRFALTSTTRVGTDRFVITARDGERVVTLYPFLEVRSEPPVALHVGLDRISASRGGAVPFVLDRPDLAGATYWLTASVDGTSPAIGTGVLSLGRERSLAFLARHAFLTRQAGAAGSLDPSGRAEPVLVAPPGALTALIGRRLSWAAALSSGSRVTPTNTVGFEVIP